MKLTQQQVLALRSLPYEITTWGGERITPLPRGVRSVSTFTALHKRGLLRIVRKERGTLEYRITKAGVDALRELEQ